MKYCAEGRDERFGVIEFAVGADVTPIAVRQRIAMLVPFDIKSLPCYTLKTFLPFPV